MQNLVPWSLQSRFPRIESDSLITIQSLPSNDEIKEAVFLMGGLKAPVRDGMHALFYKKYWDLVGSSFCDLIKAIFVDPS